MLFKENYPRPRLGEEFWSIVQAFSRSGRCITGRFLLGNTGAFRESDTGRPILPTHAVLRLIRMS
jgi:hypothetical protein